MHQLRSILDRGDTSPSVSEKRSPRPDWTGESRKEREREKEEDTPGPVVPIHLGVEVVAVHAEPVVGKLGGANVARRREALTDGHLTEGGESREQQGPCRHFYV